MTNDLARVYMHEDVHNLPNQVPDYLPNMGSHWPFSEDIRHDLIGNFGQLRACGRWPRAVNLWELDWPRMVGQLTEQFGEARAASPDFEIWWRRSLTQRKGGFDRWMYAGPGSPTLAEISIDEPLPCVLQQKAHVRPGAEDDYLAGLYERAASELPGTGWRAMMWFRCMHSSETFVYLSAANWAGLLDAAAVLPARDAAYQHRVLQTSALSAWEGSLYLKR